MSTTKTCSLCAIAKSAGDPVRDHLAKAAKAFAAGVVTGMRVADNPMQMANVLFSFCDGHATRVAFHTNELLTLMGGEGWMRSETDAVTKGPSS